MEQHEDIYDLVVINVEKFDNILNNNIGNISVLENLLHYACSFSLVDQVERILRNKHVDVNCVQTNEYVKSVKRTPLLRACFVKLLLDHKDIIVDEELIFWCEHEILEILVKSGKLEMNNDALGFVLDFIKIDYKSVELVLQHMTKDAIHRYYYETLDGYFDYDSKFRHLMLKYLQ